MTIKQERHEEAAIERIIDALDNKLGESIDAVLDAKNITGLHVAVPERYYGSVNKLSEVITHHPITGYVYPSQGMEYDMHSSGGPERRQASITWDIKCDVLFMAAMQSQVTINGRPIEQKVEVIHKRACVYRDAVIRTVETYATKDDAIHHIEAKRKFLPVDARGEVDGVEDEYHLGLGSVVFEVKQKITKPQPKRAFSFNN